MALIWGGWLFSPIGLAPPMAPPSMDYWVGFFRGAGESIFDAIDAAIDVAASDHPAALRARRDAIAERLYTALLVVSSGAPASAAAASPQAGVPAAEPQAQAQQLQQQQLLPEGAGSVPSLCSSDRAEAITDDGAPRRDDDDSVAAEAERIKADLLNYHEKVAPSPCSPRRRRRPCRWSLAGNCSVCAESVLLSCHSRRRRCSSCSGGCSSWSSRCTP